MIDDSWIEEGEPWPDETDESLGEAIRAIKALPPRVKAKHAEIEQARLAVRDLSYQLREAQFTLDELQNGNLVEVRQAIASAVGIDTSELYLGSWDCLHSPTGSCFYNGVKDQALDFCLLCGGPDERK
jgi:hypothetical protein